LSVRIGVYVVGMSTQTSQTTSERLALPVGEVAELLGVSERHVWQLAASGRLPKPIRLGRSVRWLRDDLVAHLASLRDRRAGGV